MQRGGVESNAQRVRKVAKWLVEGDYGSLRAALGRKWKKLAVWALDQIDTRKSNYKHGLDRYDVCKVYGGENFSIRPRDAYRHFAECVWQTLRPSRGVADIGCGQGFILEFFQEKGFSVLGVDCSEEIFSFCPASVKDHILVFDLRDDIRPYVPRGEYDLVICTEVAEHVEPQFEDVLLDNVFHFARDAVILSWSPDWCIHRGTSRQEHWNPRPKRYVVKKVYKRFGFKQQDDLTARLIGELGSHRHIRKDFGHWIANVMVFRREYRV